MQEEELKIELTLEGNIIKLSMHDVMVYGAYRVGQKRLKGESCRAIAPII